MRIIVTEIVILELFDFSDIFTNSKDGSTRSEGRNDNCNFSTRSCQTSTKDTINRVNINSCSCISFTRRSNKNRLNLSRNGCAFSISAISNSNLYQTTFTIATDRNATISSYCIFSSWFVDLYTFNLSCRFNARYNR